MLNKAQSISHTPTSLNLATGRILIIFLAVFLLLIRITQPPSDSSDLTGPILSSLILIYCLSVFALSFFNETVKRNLYWLVFLAFVLYASGFYYFIYKSNFLASTTSGLFVFSILTAYFLLSLEHLIIYQVFLIAFLFMTYFIAPSPPENALNFVIRFTGIQIIVLLVLGSRVRFIQNLIASNEEKEQMIRGLNCGVFQIDREGKFTLANNMFCHMTEYSHNEISKKLTFKDLVLSTDWEMVRGIIEESYEGGSDKFEARLVNKEGKPFWVFGTATPRFSNDKNVIGTTFIMADISQKKAMADEYLEKMQDQELTIKGLIQKNEELQKFAHWAALELRIVHESMNQPLSSLQDEKQNDQALGQLVQSSKQLDEVIDRLQFYSLANFVKPHYELVDPSAILKEIIDSLEVEIKLNDASIVFSDLPEIEADPSQFYRLLHNLIENGLKYRGAITPKISISSTEDLAKEEYVFAIEDNGIGINKNDYEKIFRLFEQDEEEDHGALGLGLAICKKIVINHGGRLWFTSNHGKGSTFFFSIPTKRPEGLTSLENDSNKVPTP